MQLDDQLHWGFFEEDDFIIGPNFSGVADNYEQRQVASSISKTIDKNSTLVAVTEKNRGNTGNATPGGNTDLISRSSATRRNHSRQGVSVVGHQQATMGLQRWKLYKCSECQVWTHAVNEHESRYAVLLNNRIKERKLSRLGLLAGKYEINANSTVRVPILENIKLEQIPF